MRVRSYALCGYLPSRSLRPPTVQEVAAPGAPPNGARPIFKIGVMSPPTTLGLSYEQTVQRVLGPSSSVPTENGEIELVPVVRHYGSNGECGAVARKLVEKDEVIAIIGPVHSECASILLRESLCTPVISPLASATSLTEDRDPWFFRTAARDRDRLGRLYEVKRRRGEWPPKAPIILYDDQDEFSKGLFDDLKSLLPDPASLPVVDATKDEWPLEAQEEVDVFVFAPRDVDAAIRFQQRRADKKRQRTTLHFVGANADYLSRAPVGSYVVGDPALDDPTTTQATNPPSDTAAVGALGLLAVDETARFVVPPAVREAYQAAVAEESPNAPPSGGVRKVPPQRLRELIRSTLEATGHCYDSLQPPRKICFDRGDVRDLPPVPVYEITNGQKRFDIAERPDWFEIETPTQVGLYEEPVRVRVTARGEALRKEATLVVRRNGEYDSSRTLRLEGGTALATVHPIWPGSYTFATDGRYFPAQATTNVTVGVVYVLALVGALVTTALSVLSTWLGGGTGATPRPHTTPRGVIWRVLLGSLAGIVLAFVCLYIRSIAGSLPIPSFSTDPAINALVAGLVGGALAPRLADRIAGWMP